MGRLETIKVVAVSLFNLNWWFALCAWREIFEGSFAITTTATVVLCLTQCTSGPRLALFSYENLGSAAQELSLKCEMLGCENSTLAIICPLLLINGIDVTIWWVGLAKPSKEISCSQNLAAACDFYDAWRSFYASSYKNLVEKSERHASGYAESPKLNFWE